MEISEKSKKNEILDAYYDLLKKVQLGKDENHQATLLKKQEDEVVVKAAQYDDSEIVTTLGQVKILVAQSLGQLEKKLVEEYSRLSDLQTAIKIETKNLEEYHQITKNADSLSALLLAQKERKAEFEAEMAEAEKIFEQEVAQKKLEWKLEKERYDKTRAEYEANIKKERMREEEEYKYKMNLERTKDADAYEAQKAAFEKEITERQEALEKEWAAREQALATTEQEVSQLRTKVAAFPKELEQAVEFAKKTLQENLEREYTSRTKLREAEIEGEKKLQQQTIVSLQKRVQELDVYIRDLNQKAELATQQVQSIALKALESASGIATRYETEAPKQVQRQQ